jgi:hypothetical protein
LVGDAARLRIVLGGEFDLAAVPRSNSSCSVSTDGARACGVDIHEVTVCDTTHLNMAACRAGRMSTKRR